MSMEWPTCISTLGISISYLHETILVCRKSQGSWYICDCVYDYDNDSYFWEGQLRSGDFKIANLGSDRQIQNSNLGLLTLHMLFSYFNIPEEREWQ